MSNLCPKKTLKIEKSGCISIHGFALNALTPRFSIFFHEIFKINVELNFALNLLLEFF